MPAASCVIDLPSLEATFLLGRRLGAFLQRGAVVGLVGTLGAGKTHLTRAIAEGLGVPDGRMVTSPTFVLIQEYEGRLPVYHFDAYRLPNAASFLDLGAGEYLEGEGVCLIEWADRVRDCLPNDCLWVELEVTGPTSRRATVRASGRAYCPLLQGLGESTRGDC
jgi:tRNA threonylcarbamoyladenosine biosynthesis protein TsaE